MPRGYLLIASGTNISMTKSLNSVGASSGISEETADL
jgi:hypothetical protein